MHIAEIIIVRIIFLYHDCRDAIFDMNNIMETIVNNSFLLRKNDYLGVQQIYFSTDKRQCVGTELLKKKYNFHIISLDSPHPVEHPKISYNAGLA